MIEKPKVVATYATTPMQKGMLFHSAADKSRGVYNLQIVCTLREDILVGDFHAALRHIIRQHEALRTVFRFPAASDPVQEVWEDIEIKLEVADLRHFESALRERRLNEFILRSRNEWINPGSMPPMRFNLVLLGDSESCFVWTVPHAILDRPAVAIVLRQLLDTYDALRKGEEVSGGFPLCNLGSYVQWETSHDISGSKNYWQETFEAFLPAPPHFNRGNKGAWNEEEIVLPEDLTQALEKIAEENGCTLNTVLQAVWSICRGINATDLDVVFGITRSCRPRFPHGDSIVGLCMNTLPLHIACSGKDSFVALLRQIRQQVLALRPFEATPLATIQAWIGAGVDKALFNTLMVFNPVEINHAVFATRPESQHRRIHLVSPTHYDIVLSAHREPEFALQVAAFEDTGEDFCRLLNRLRILLEQVAVKPAIPISDLELMSREERKRVLEEWNSTEAAFPADKLLHTTFEEQVRRTPEAVAVTCSGEEVSYRELNRRADALARELQRWGAGPEVRIGICLPRSIEMIVALLGILKAGAAYVPLDPEYPAERLKWMIEDAQIGILVTRGKDDAYWARGKVRPIAINELKNTAAEEAGRRTATVTPANSAYVIYTSGTTGRPKGTVIEHRSAVTLLYWAREEYVQEELSGVLAATSICFDLSVFEIFVPLAWGGKVILAENILRLPAMGEGAGVKLINTVPTLMSELLRVRGVPDTVVRVNLAGEKLSRSLVEDVYKTSRARLVTNLYGPTEDTTYSTFADVRKGEVEAVPIGEPIANTKAYVLIAGMRPAPVGVTGELYLGGDGLARGYWCRPALTAERFVPDPFSSLPGKRLYRTGDLARWREDGKLEYLERIDEQVKLRGFRVELGEIEAILKEHECLEQAVVVLHEHQHGEKRLVAYVTPRAGKEYVGDEAVRRYLQARLPEYMVPALIMGIPAIPMTRNGKLHRAALPQPAWNSEGGCTAPRTRTEELLVQIWGEILGLQHIGTQDNFFRLGGHSLLALRVIWEMEKAFGFQVPVQWLFESPTIQSCGARLDTIGRQRVLRSEEYSASSSRGES